MDPSVLWRRHIHPKEPAVARVVGSLAPQTVHREVQTESGGSVIVVRHHDGGGSEARRRGGQSHKLKPLQHAVVVVRYWRLHFDGSRGEGNRRGNSRERRVARNKGHDQVGRQRLVQPDSARGGDSPASPSTSPSAGSGSGCVRGETPAERCRRSVLVHRPRARPAPDRSGPPRSSPSRSRWTALPTPGGRARRLPRPGRAQIGRGSGFPRSVAPTANPGCPGCCIGRRAANSIEWR